MAVLHLGDDGIGMYPNRFPWVNFRAMTDWIGAEAIAVFNIVIPESEKKFLWMKRGLPTPSCTQAISPSTPCWSIATWLRDTVSLESNSDGSLTTSVVDWKTWNDRVENLGINGQIANSNPKLTSTKHRESGSQAGCNKMKEHYWLVHAVYVALSFICRYSRTEKCISVLTG